MFYPFLCHSLIVALVYIHTDHTSILSLPILSGITPCFDILLSSKMISVQICDVGVIVLMYLYCFSFILRMGLYLDSDWKVSLHKWLVVATCSVLPLDAPTMTLLFPSVLCCNFILYWIEIIDAYFSMITSASAQNT